MTDAERNKNNDFKKLWYGGYKNLKTLVSPKCTNDNFKFLRNSSNFEFDQNWIYYTDSTDNKTYKVKFDGTGKSLK